MYGVKVIPQNTDVNPSSPSTFPPVTTQFTQSSSQNTETTATPTITTQLPPKPQSTSVTTLTSTGTTQSTDSTSAITTNRVSATINTDQSETTLFSANTECQDFTFGDECSFGANDLSAHIDAEKIPTRVANFTLEIRIDYLDAFNDLTSRESLEFIKTLKRELEALCKQAYPQAYETVKVTNLSRGCVVAQSVAEYRYLNSETEIQFVNTQLEDVLMDILNDTRNLNKISQVFGNESVQLNGLSFQAPLITHITDLKPFVNCSGFANYTPGISNGQWKCVGPCKLNPNYCNHHGECHNHMNKGPICSCYETSFEQYYGPQCELFRRGPGFFGALFGSLAAVLLLLIIIVIAVIVKKRHTSVWKRSNFYRRRLSFEEDFFDFSHTGDLNFGFLGTYTAKQY
ncbi:mucin-4 [Brachyistius frenatus]|uniref:mucin-4 n=1 Tax=Brachyistius frenatus TaxID=100188 RepID=UPI0037E7586C